MTPRAAGRGVRCLLLRGIALAAVNLVALEAMLRLVNALVPLERPAHLLDRYASHWLEGRDWTNGLTRLYVFAPGSLGSTYGHPLRVNRWGFRGADFLERDRPEAQRAFRVAVLGDSVTAGLGVAEEDRYSDVLQRRLSARCTSGRIEVVNLGVHGYETVQEEKILRRMWDVVGPDLTVVGFYVNDPNITYDHHALHPIPTPERLRPMVGKLLTFRLLEPPYDRTYRWLWRLPTHEETVRRAYDPTSRDWQAFVSSVNAIARWVHARGRRPPVAVFLADVEEARRHGMYEGPRDVFARAGFVWSEVEGRNYAAVSRHEAHPNEQAHRCIAEALERTLDRHGLVPRGVCEGGVAG